MHPIIICISLLLLFSGSPLYSVKPYVPKMANPVSESWRWKNFPELEGKGVRDIAQGRDGKVWIGADDGVYEYNGYYWKLHKKDDNGLLHVPIEDVLIRKNGQVCVVAANQIYTYLGGRWQPVLPIPIPYDFNFSQAIELSDQSLMVSSDVGVLHLPREGKPIFYTASSLIETFQNHELDFIWKRLPETLMEGIQFSEISDLLEEENGQIWFAFTFGESGKLLRFTPSLGQSPYLVDYEIYSSSQGFNLGEGQKLMQSADKKIWVVNSSSRIPIQIFSQGQWETIRLGEIFATDEYVNDIVQTEDGTIWIGALGKLYALQNEHWNLYESSGFKIPANKLQLYKGWNNQLWIAGLKSKVYLLDYSTDRWVTYEDLNFQCVANEDEQWFIDVEGKAISKNGNRWIAWGPEDGLIDAPVRIIATKNGQIWAAGSHQGIAATAWLKNEKWILQLHPTLSWGIDYRAVFEAGDGSIWFGGSVDSDPAKGQFGGAIQLLNPGREPLKWVHHRYNENGLNQSNVYGVGQTPDGTIWTGGSSLIFFNGNSWQRTGKERLNQYVNTLDNTDNLLIVGSRYYGIFIFDGTNWKNYNTESGLTNNTIISIDANANDDIWVATENDICHFDGHQWQNNIFPVEMNMDFEGGDIKHTPDGLIWINRSDRSWKRRAFNTSGKKQAGYNNFITHCYKPDEQPPETKITFFTDEVSSDGNTLIQWSGKDFFGETPDDKLLFSYRLNGEAWSSFSKFPQKTFTSLSNGNYQLEVRAMDLVGNIDPTPAQITFKVHPAVWKQPWFILLISTLLSIITFFGYKIFTKNKKLEKLNENLRLVNSELQDKGLQIQEQNIEILKQQSLILEQKKSLEINNVNLENQNQEIQHQRDKLELMVVQVEELSKAKLSFFTNISHELRTPLSLILGPVHQLIREEQHEKSTERKSLYEIIERNANRLLKLINQLLEIRRIENSSLDFRPTEMNLNEFLSTIVDLFRNVSEKREISLLFQSEGAANTGFVDPDKVEKIVVNLIANAFKHTPDGGLISLEIQTVEADTYALPTLYDAYFQISVVDSGKGIEPEVLNHIFDRYFSKNTGNKHEHSSGIGLSYIKDLVQIHQGVIRVESTPGNGSKFHVFLPVIKEFQAESAETFSNFEYQYAQQEVIAVLSSLEERQYVPDPTLTESESDHPTILIAEDNHDMLVFLQGILQEKYRIITAPNGKEALEIAKSYPIDLILSDIMMPEMDGLEFCRRLKTDFTTSHLPVVLLTARSLEEHQLAGYETGANDYITKPFNPRILDLKIANLLNQRKAFQTKISREFQLAPKEVHLSSPDEELLQTLIELMEANIDNSSFNVNAMCESVNLSHMHFIRKVKKLTGKRPIDLLRSFRMKRAKDLLAQNKLTISEIAYSVGFDMPSSFSRAFKKEFGESPTHFVARMETVK